MSETLLFSLGAACTLYALAETARLGFRARLAYRPRPRQRAMASDRPLTLRRDRRNTPRRASDRRAPGSETIVVISPEDA